MSRGEYKAKLIVTVWSALGVILLASSLTTAPAASRLQSGQLASSMLGLNVFGGSYGITGTGRGVSFPTDVKVCPITGKIFVVDPSRNRVLRFPAIAAEESDWPPEAVLGQRNFESSERGTGKTGMSTPVYLGIDSAGRLYVSEIDGRRVLRFDHPAGAANGAAADGVIGKTTFEPEFGITPETSFRRPIGLALDSADRLYVADADKHRVFRYNNPAADTFVPDPDGVLGRTNFVSDFNRSVSDRTFSSPEALVLDPQDRLYVYDTGNRRVLRFDHPAQLTNGAPADGVIGQSSFTNMVTSFGSRPIDEFSFRAGGLAMDDGGRLYVSDFGDNRVLRFDQPETILTGGTAAAVIGQPTFYTNLSDSGTSGLWGPAGMDFVNGTTLLIADRDNHRVLRFDNAGSLNNGPTADGFVGLSPDIYNYHARMADFSAARPAGVAIDPASGKVFVSDGEAHRILRYPRRALYRTGVRPEAILGQYGFYDWDPGLAADRLNQPAGIAIDEDGRLYVSDRGNHRVVRFDNAVTATNGTSASAVFGQPDFASDQSGTNSSSFDAPWNVAISQSDQLYVVDLKNSRVLRFDGASSVIAGTSATAVFQTKPDSFGQDELYRSHIVLPTGVAIDSADQLYVADASLNRILRFDQAGSLSGQALASAVIGQTTFTNFGTSSNSVFVTPQGLAISADGTLFVGFNFGVAWFDEVATKTNGAPPDGYLGGTPSLQGLGGLRSVTSIAIAPDGTLIAADPENYRVLAYKPPTNDPPLAITKTPTGDLTLTLQVSDPQNWRLESRRDSGNGTWQPLDTPPIGNQWTLPVSAQSPRRVFRAVRAEFAIQ